MRVLVVEDEVDLARTLKRTLEEEGYAVDVAHDGEGGLWNAENWAYDGIVLDLMLPKIDGWAVLQRLRKTKKTPVLILTARDATVDKVRGLDTGADDYLTKPFELDEFLARVRALVRRGAGAPSPLISIGDVEINTARRSVTKSGAPVEMTGKEYALLELLAMSRGKLVTRTTIYDHIYDEQDDSMSNVVDVYIANLRKKLGKDFITTRRGEGYIVDG